MTLEKSSQYLKELSVKLDTEDYYTKSSGYTEQEINDKHINIVSDPFFKDNVTSIWMSYSKVLFESYSAWTGQVTVTKGNSTADIKTKKHATLPSLLMEIEQIIHSLK